MKENIPARVKIVRKPALIDTLKSLTIGEPTRFNNIKDFKVSIVRQLVVRLKKQGYDFTVNEKGMVSEYIVTRLK